MQPVPKAYDFFISRAGADDAWAKWISHVLREAGYSTHVQNETFVPGVSFVEDINRGIGNDRTIAVMSPEYFSSPFTTLEWQGVVAQHPDRLVTVLIRCCEIPPAIAHKTYINLVGKNEEQARELLLDGIRGVPRRGLAPFPGTPARFPGPTFVSVAKLPAVNPLLVGREAELERLDKAWIEPAVRLVTIVAFGGVGKTALSINWWHRNQAPGAKRVLGWSFFSQGAAEDQQASADPFLDYALREWFGVTNPPLGSWARGERLAECVAASVLC